MFALRDGNDPEDRRFNYPTTRNGGDIPSLTEPNNGEIMNISELIEQIGGSHALDAVGDIAGLSRDDVTSMIDSVGPMVMRALQHRTSTDDGLVSFRDALRTGGHSRYIDDPTTIATEDAITDGAGILGHIFGDTKTNRNVAAEAANRTGIDSSLIEKALPVVASLVMGALAKQSNAGHDLRTSTSESNPLGPLASFFDQDHDGSVLDDIIGMASRYI